MSEPTNREAAVLNVALQLRRAERPARSLDKLQRGLATVLNSFSVTHCRGFFRQSRYASIIEQRTLERQVPGSAERRRMFVSFLIGQDI